MVGWGGGRTQEGERKEQEEQGEGEEQEQGGEIVYIPRFSRECCMRASLTTV